MILREVIGVGSTVEAAMEDAMNQLDPGLEDNVKTETLSLPKKKVLGVFGGSDAKVRAYIEVEDEIRKPKKEAKNIKPKNDKKQPVKKEVVKDNKKIVKEEKIETKESVGVPAEKVDANSPAGRAYAYLKTVLEKLDCADISATISEVEGGSKITLNGSDKLGVIIGRRGETLDALQYLASLVANERGGGYYRLVVDIGNYREKRENTLEALAKRTAVQVLRTGRNRTLEPMNPYERRIIHTAIQSIDGVSSTSVGDGMGRRVVISLEGKPVRLSNGRGSKNGNHRAASAQKENSRQAKTLETQKPKETDGTKLYGRLG